jgi:hypothetical protein
MDKESQWKEASAARAELEKLLGLARSGDGAGLRTFLDEWAAENSRPASEAIESFRDANGRCASGAVPFRFHHQLRPCCIAPAATHPHTP